MGLFSEIDVTIPRPVIIHTTPRKDQEHKETVIRFETGEKKVRIDE